MLLRTHDSASIGAAVFRASLATWPNTAAASSSGASDLVDGGVPLRRRSANPLARAPGAAEVGVGDVSEVTDDAHLRDPRYPQPPAVGGGGLRKPARRPRSEDKGYVLGLDRRRGFLPPRGPLLGCLLPEGEDANVNRGQRKGQQQDGQNHYRDGEYRPRPNLVQERQRPPADLPQECLQTLDHAVHLGGPRAPAFFARLLDPRCCPEPYWVRIG